MFFLTHTVLHTSLPRFLFFEMSKFIATSENLVKSSEEVLCKMMMYAMSFFSQLTHHKC